MYFSDLLHRYGVAGITAVHVLALAPPVAVSLWQGGAATLAVFVPALAIVLVWDVVFSSLRRRPFLPLGITTALIFTVLAPSSASLWQLVVVLSLGTVIGELVFGGRGFAFLSGAVVALALWVLSFPAVPLGQPSLALAFATLPGALVLLLTGLVHWRIVVSFLAVLAVIYGLSDGELSAELALGSLFALTFLIADPTASSATGVGRIIQGALAAFLVVLFDQLPGAAVSTDALVFAALLTSLFVPLIDYAAGALNAWQRRARRA